MAGEQYIYTMRNVSKSYPGGKEVLKDITLQFLPGAKIGVLGVNGSGKSSLLKIMAGIDTTHNGEAWAAKGVKIGYLPQEPQLDEKLTVAENVMSGLGEIKQTVDQFNAISMKLGEVSDNDEMMALIEEQSDLQEIIDAHDAWDLDQTVEMAMDALRCPIGSSAVTNLSGGERRRVALCRELLAKPDILLLDEPTNHLDAETISWLQNHLKEFKGMVVMVTHDRYFLDNVTGWILELDRGQGIPYQGNYSSWLDQKQKRLAQESKMEKSRLRILEQEQEWINSSPRARQAKSKARIQSYEKLLNDSQNKKIEDSQIAIPAGPRLGSQVIEAEGLAKAFGDTLLIEDVSFNLPPGGIVGIIGPNGAGKTTLFRMITGQETADKGSLTIGSTVKLGYVDQSRDDLADDKSVWEVISDGLDVVQLGKREMPSRAYVGSFNFKGADQQKKVGSLSGGERNRVHLARMLKSGANVLLLDEPTNDLDVDTLRALEDGLMDFAGCAVIVSHDRWFLDRIATHIMAFEGDSKVVWFEGNYQGYMEDRARRGLNEGPPTRIRYRKLARN